MKLTAEILATVALLSLFCASHSILASNKIKKAFQNRFGNLIAFYRIGYNIVSIISFVIIYKMLPQIDLTVYELPGQFRNVFLLLQFISFLGIVWCAKYFSTGEFLGWAQLKRFRKSIYDSSDLDEKSELRIEGSYKYSRHPVYFFSIMFLIMRPVMGLTYLLIVVIFTAYFYIGSIFEEKRLVEKFGEAYLKYQKAVPRIFPIKIFRA